jgi:hypothetical protein
VVNLQIEHGNSILVGEIMVASARKVIGDVPAIEGKDGVIGRPACGELKI